MGKLRSAVPTVTRGATAPALLSHLGVFPRRSAHPPHRYREHLTRQGVSAALGGARQRNQKESWALVQPQLCHPRCVTLGKSLWSLGSQQTAREKTDTGAGQGCRVKVKRVASIVQGLFLPSCTHTPPHLAPALLKSLGPHTKAHPSRPRPKLLGDGSPWQHRLPTQLQLGSEPPWSTFLGSPAP